MGSLRSRYQRVLHQARVTWSVHRHVLIKQKFIDLIFSFFVYDVIYFFVWFLILFFIRFFWIPPIYYLTISHFADFASFATLPTGPSICDDVSCRFHIDNNNGDINTREYIQPYTRYKITIIAVLNGRMGLPSEPVYALTGEAGWCC